MISDIVLVSLITAVATLAAAIIGQYLAAQASRKQADRSAQREELARTRNLAIEQAKTKSDQLNRFLGQVLRTRTRMIELQEKMYRQLEHGNPTPIPLGGYSDTPAAIASDAYAIALLSLPELRALAKDFDRTSTKLQLAIEQLDDTHFAALHHTWRQAYSALEATVSKLSDEISTVNLTKNEENHTQGR